VGEGKEGRGEREVSCIVVGGARHCLVVEAWKCNSNGVVTLRDDWCEEEGEGRALEPSLHRRRRS
jgi:hypothetical protein